MDDQIQTRVEVIKEIFYDSIFTQNKNEVLCYCPNFCNRNKRKLSINVEKNAFQCWVCGEKQSGSVLKLLRKYANKQQREKYLKTLPKNHSQILYQPDEKLDISLPDSYIHILEALSYSELRQFCVDFITKSGFTDDNLYHFKIGVCPSGKYFNRIIFPSFDKNGDLNYFITRSLTDEHYKKYLDCELKKHKIIFNEYLINWEKPIVLVENVKAHIVHNECDFNVIPIIGNFTLNEKSKLLNEMIFNECSTVYVAFDSDTNKHIDYMKNLQKHDIKCKKVDLLPFNQPEELSTEEFTKRIMSATSFSSNELLREKLSKI